MKDINGRIKCIFVPGNFVNYIDLLIYLFHLVTKGFGALDGTPCKVSSPVPGVNVNFYFHFFLKQNC